jgi:glyoxylase-like metal-dependent hydrolase (beta-lactamase superfamily II)
MRVETLDLGFQGTPHVIASFLVLGGEGPVLVETGPGSTLSVLLERLADRGFTPDEVRHVLVTHIHLDHAGAAGWWAQQGAQIYVHPIGAPHLIDPAKLLASARRIYGEEMDSLWGEIVPAPAERVTAVEDGEEIEAAGLRFTALATPGHASHHHVYRLGNAAFTGDAMAIRIPGLDWIDLPAPPPEFDLEVWKATLERLREEKFETIYRTHFGSSEDVGTELDRLAILLDETARFVRGLLEQGLERQAMVRAYKDWVGSRASAAGANDEMLHAYEVANPWEMSVDGIARYWRKRSDQQIPGS